ncbi:MAG: DUF6506 family protein [Cohaesibacter sp.]|nr:DUF6506 family protein [Cohaesibacter sp.]MCV6600382.1 DUF6506 family protein [Cohaesibacter sp.]
MKLSQYAFIMIGEGYSPAQITTLTSDHFSTTLICVANIDMACDEARKLVAEGVQLIELCGAFKDQMIDAIIETVDGKIPVGNMGMRDDERAKLMTFLQG